MTTLMSATQKPPTNVFTTLVGGVLIKINPYDLYAARTK